jgi:hypothetical protein
MTGGVKGGASKYFCAFEVPPCFVHNQLNSQETEVLSYKF